jgi:hypothetical protein
MLWPPLRPVLRPMLSGEDPLLLERRFRRADRHWSARSRGVSSGLAAMFLQSSHLHLSVHLTCALSTLRVRGSLQTSTPKQASGEGTQGERTGNIRNIS